MHIFLIFYWVHCLKIKRERKLLRFNKGLLIHNKLPLKFFRADLPSGSKNCFILTILKYFISTYQINVILLMGQIGIMNSLKSDSEVCFCSRAM